MRNCVIYRSSIVEPKSPDQTLISYRILVGRSDNMGWVVTQEIYVNITTSQHFCKNCHNIIWPCLSGKYPLTLTRQSIIYNLLTHSINICLLHSSLGVYGLILAAR